jgi:hypothetical protein
MLTVLEDLWPQDLPREDHTIGLLATFFHECVLTVLSATSVVAALRALSRRLRPWPYPACSQRRV